MNKQDLIEYQLEIEHESVTLGQTRYRGERKLPWQKDEPGKKDEADLAPGKALLKRALEPTAAAITEFLDDVFKEGKAGRKHVAGPYLLHVDPLQAAYLTARVVINGAAERKTIQAVAIELGTVLQDHLDLLKMAGENRGLYRKVMDQLARSTSAKHRVGVIRHVLERYKLESLSWSKKDKLLVGSKLIELFIAAAGFVVMERESEGANNSPIRLQFNEETVAWLEAAHGKCELLSPIYLPMVVPPRPWKTPYRGGYLSDAFTIRLVNTRNRAYLDELGGVDLSRVLTAVNAIQATPWRIHKGVLDVLRAEMECGGASAGLPRRDDAPLPPRPAGVPKDVPVKDLTAMQKESLSEWKAEASKVHQSNAAAKRERVLLSQKLYIADRFADAPAIYFPHYLDFRGRVYPLGSYVNPQSDDVGRALLEFGEGKALGEDGAFWLAVHIAGLFGIDKVGFDDRVAWVFENEERILAAALEPHADNAFWREADKPFQALAACFEWAGYKMTGDEYVSHLPIAMDGSCSGLQHFSALLRDEVGGAAVNLVPGPKPSDIYMMVAKRAQELSDGCLGSTNPEMQTAWAGAVCRKVAKQPTMTLCYSATKFGMQGQIENALRKLDEESGTSHLAGGVDRHKAAVYMAEVVWHALGDVVVAARRAMDWLKEVSQVAAGAGMPVRWTSPIGLPVLQEYREHQGKVVEAFFGGVRVQLMLNIETDKISKRRQASGIAPNFVHALDASHLLSTVNACVDAGLSHFAMIHDSYAVHACDTSLLNAILRSTFVQQYSVDILTTFREEIAEQLGRVKPELVEKLPPLPTTGKLDLAAVERSEFFFA